MAYNRRLPCGRADGDKSALIGDLIASPRIPGNTT